MRAADETEGEQVNTFDEFNKINIRRANRWHNGDIHEWMSTDWATAVGGEMGELLNAIKKFRRIECRIQGHDGDTPQPKDVAAATDAIAKEIGDVYTYLDIVAEYFGLNMWDCVRDTFNEISKREEMPERMPDEFVEDDSVRLDRISQYVTDIITDRDFVVHANRVTEEAITQIQKNAQRLV